MAVVLHKIGDVVTVRSMSPALSWLSGARVKIDKLERNTDGKINGIALVTPVSDSDTHRVRRSPRHIGVSVLVSEGPSPYTYQHGQSAILYPRGWQNMTPDAMAYEGEEVIIEEVGDSGTRVSVRPLNSDDVFPVHVNRLSAPFGDRCHCRD